MCVNETAGPYLWLIVLRIQQHFYIDMNTFYIPSLSLYVICSFVSYDRSSIKWRVICQFQTLGMGKKGY